jgi:hypothetical protein
MTWTWLGCNSGGDDKKWIDSEYHFGGKTDWITFKAQDKE